MFFIFQLGRLQTVQFVLVQRFYTGATLWDMNLLIHTLYTTNKLGYDIKFAVVQITELKCKLKTAYDAHDNTKEQNVFSVRHPSKPFLWSKK